MGDTSLAIPFPIPWFKAPAIGFWSWPQCVQRLWEYLKNLTHGGATKFKMRDWELAQALGVGRRCVQKALHLAQKLGLIDRYRDYGHNGGRVIEILINLAAPKPRGARPRLKPRDKARTPKAAQTTPEQIAAEKAAATARGQTQAQQDQAREAKLRDAWQQLSEPQRAAIRAKVKAENPGLQRWENLIEPLCLLELEAMAGPPGDRAGP
jgi:hypothetical protein